MAMIQRGGGRGRGVFPFMPLAAASQSVISSETETVAKTITDEFIPAECQPAVLSPRGFPPSGPLVGRAFGQGVPGAGRGFAQGVPGVGRGIRQGINPGLGQEVTVPGATGHGLSMDLAGAGRGRGRGFLPVQPNSTNVAVPGTSDTVRADASNVSVETADKGPSLAITYGPRLVVDEPQPVSIPEKVVEEAAELDVAISAALTDDKASPKVLASAIVSETDRPFTGTAPIPPGFQPLSAPATRSGTVFQQLKKLIVKPKVEAKDARAAASRSTNTDQDGNLLSAIRVGDDFKEPGSNPIQGSKFTSWIKEVTVVNVSGLQNFYIKPPATRAAGLSLLEKKMDNWYKNYSPTIPAPAKENLVVNGQYAGFIPAIKAWRRIVFRGLSSDSRLLVQLLDDGGSHAIRIEDIRLLRGNFCTLPIQAYHAKIQMVEGEAWTTEETEIFIKEANNKQFTAIVLADENNPKLAPFRTLGLALLETGNATKVYNFGGRLRLGYAFEVEPECTMEVSAAD